MLGRRRLLRQALGGGVDRPGQQKIHEAQRLLAEGKFGEAAALFDELGQYALQRGMLRPAVNLMLQAGLAYAQAGHGDNALACARRVLDLMLKAGQPSRAAHAMPRVTAFLRVHGFTAQAAALEKEAAQRLTPLGLSLQALPNVGTRTLPPTCPQCAGPLRSDEADWIDAVSAECPWCGSAVKTV